VAGPVDADTFLREARWANETYHLAHLEAKTLSEYQAFFRKAHSDRLHREHRSRLHHQLLPRLDDPPERVAEALAQVGNLPGNNQAKVHFLLAASPMPPLGKVYQIVFEKILNEKVSTRPVEVAGR